MQETKSFLSKQHQKGEISKNKASCHLKFSFDYRKRRMGQSSYQLYRPMRLFCFHSLKKSLFPLPRQMELECGVFRHFPVNGEACVHQGGAGVQLPAAVYGVHGFRIQALGTDILLGAVAG